MCADCISQRKQLGVYSTQATRTLVRSRCVVAPLFLSASSPWPFLISLLLILLFHFNPFPSPPFLRPESTCSGVHRKVPELRQGRLRGRIGQYDVSLLQMECVFQPHAAPHPPPRVLSKTLNYDPLYSRFFTFICRQISTTPMQRVWAREDQHSVTRDRHQRRQSYS